MIWSHILWYDSIFDDIISYLMIWCHILWYDIISYDMISYLMIWFHIIWNNIKNIIIYGKKHKWYESCSRDNDYDMKIRSFDTEFHCGSFVYVWYFWTLVWFFNVIFKVIFKNDCSSHTFLKYDIITYDMTSHLMICYHILWYDVISYDMI